MDPGVDERRAGDDPHERRLAVPTTQVKILVPGSQPMVALLGQRDAFLKIIEDAFDARSSSAATRSRSAGPPTRPSTSARLFEELLTLLEKGHELTASSVGQTIELIRRGRRRPAPSEVLGDTLLTARGKGVAPKTLGQKRYVDAIRVDTVTFAIGPAGTGKTYLAVATAVRALQDHQVLAADPHAARGRGRRAPRASCPARSTRRSTRTCGRCTTRCSR